MMRTLLVSWLMLLAAALPGSPSPRLVDVRVLSDTTLCLVWDQTEEILSQARSVAIAAGAGLPEPAPPAWPRWKLERVFDTEVDAALHRLRPPFVRAIRDPGSYRVTAGPSRVPARVLAHWSAAVGSMPATAGTRDRVSDRSRIADYVYLRLDRPLAEGRPVAVEALGARGAVDFRATRTVNWSLKVNQVAYPSRDGARRIAYLGMWCGPAGPLDFSSWSDREFHIREFRPGTGRYDGEAVGLPLFRGRIRPRQPASAPAGRRSGQLVNGEDVYELDFSPFRRPGRYVIVVPGLGRSWSFRIDDAPTGEAYYHTVRALFHQRAGQAVDARNSAWSRPASHTVVRAGGFLPSGPWYGSTSYSGVREGEPASYGFRDATTGRAVAVRSFDLVAATATGRVRPEVHGGWWDAADFDRRIEHLAVTVDLASAYELFPRNFPDGQLSLPESGNGIPDVLDEALVAVRLFRSTQTPKGGISGWVEAPRHPTHEFRPENDPLKYYASLPMRPATAQYAASAALMARLVRPFDASLASDLTQSAIRAASWAASPANRITNLRVALSLPRGEHRTVVFDERPETVEPELLKAWVQLWITTGRPEFLARYRALHHLPGKPLPGALAVAQWLQSHPDGDALEFAGMFAHPDRFSPEEMQVVTSALERTCAPFLEGMEQSAYHQVSWPQESPFARNIGWGKGHPVYLARNLLLAWKATGKEKYREAVERAVDWQLGANQLGRVTTTGLGTIFPVEIQHIFSQLNGIAEPVPGITPFSFIEGVSRHAVRELLGHLACPLGKRDGDPHVADALVNPELRPAVEHAGDEPARAAALRSAAVALWPIWRRVDIHRTGAPEQNEFTVHESLGCHAAVYGALLTPGWKPSAALTDRRPIPADALPTYYQP